MTAPSFFFSIPMLAILGLILGSFINVVVYRLPKKMEREWLADARATLGAVEAEADKLDSEHGVDTGHLSGRSVCPACKTPIKWYLLTPLLGWFFAKGHCSSCGVAISRRYPAVELFVGLVFALVAWRVGPQPVVLAWAALAACLTALALIDADTMLLPDVIVLPLMWAGLLLAAFGLSHVRLQDAVIGAAAGYMILWLVTEVFRLVTGKVGMGNGDMKLLAAGGAWLGWIALIDVVLLASVVGAVFGIYQRISGQSAKGQAYSFGPFLAAAIAGVAFWNYPGVKLALG